MKNYLLKLLSLLTTLVVFITNVSIVSFSEESENRSIDGLFASDSTSNLEEYLSDYIFNNITDTVLLEINVPKGSPYTCLSRSNMELLSNYHDSGYSIILNFIFYEENTDIKYKVKVSSSKISDYWKTMGNDEYIDLSLDFVTDHQNKKLFIKGKNLLEKHKNMNLDLDYHIAAYANCSLLAPCGLLDQYANPIDKLAMYSLTDEEYISEIEYCNDLYFTINDNYREGVYISTLKDGDINSGDNSGSGDNNNDNDINTSDEEYIIWANGNNSSKPEENHKTIFIPLKNMKGADAVPLDTLTPVNELSPSLQKNCKYSISVTDRTITDVNEAIIKSQISKNASASASYVKKSDSIKISAKKQAGKIRIWVAEYNKKTKRVIAYSFVDVEVKVAPKKFTVVVPEVIEDNEIISPEIKSNAIMSVGDTITLNAKSGTVVISPDNKYAWSLSLPKGATSDMVTLTPSADTSSCTVKVNSLIYNNRKVIFTVNCVNLYSNIKSKIKIKAENRVMNVSEIENSISIPSALKNKQTITVSPEITTCIDGVSETCNDYSIYFFEGTETEYTTSKTGKFKFDRKKLSEYVSGKVDKTGNITINVKKKTPDNTKARFILVVTHEDKSFDAYESGIITVG